MGDLEIPTWVNEPGYRYRGYKGLMRALEVIREEERERLARPEDYPPPERGSQGAAAGYVFIAAIAGSLSAIVFTLYLIGS